MFWRDTNQKIAILLLPLLRGFSFQSALEVFHPIEEGIAPSHQHEGSGNVVHAAPDRGTGHAPHACAHSGAFAQIGLRGSNLSDSPLCATAPLFPDTPLVRYASNVFQRGPPRA